MLTNNLLLVRPANFGRASETVQDNSFQAPVTDLTFDEIGRRAVEEFDRFVGVLRKAGVSVHVVEDTPVPVKPDAVFPNNWFSTHDDGLLVFYPLFWPQRRLERENPVVEYLDRHFRIGRTMDLSGWEAEGRFLESTGVLVLDRERRIAYAGLSQRCDASAVHDWCDAMDYRPITFHATDARGDVIYHTNVMMAVGEDDVIVCLDAVSDPEEKSKLIDAIALSGKRIIGLSLEQIDNFAGNALQVATPEGPTWIMSTAAYDSLAGEQVEALLARPGSRILHSDLSTIEKYGGGSARCMLAELFLPE